MFSGILRVMVQSLRRLARLFLSSLAIVVAPEILLAQTQDGSPRPGWSSGLFLDGLVVSSPAIGPDGTIYVAANTDTTASRGRMWAIRPDGTRKWPLPGYFPADGDITGSPALSADGRTLYFGSWDGRFYALDTATGRKKWHFTVDVDVPTIIVAASPAIASNGTIYFGSSDLDFTRPGSLHALVDEETQGRSILTRRVSGAVETTPAIGPDGTVYFGALDPSISSPAEQTIAGRLYAVRPEDLFDKWPSIRVAGQVFSSPAIGRDGTIYFGDYVDGLHAISPTGERKWSYPAGAIEAAPSLGADGAIYVGSIQDWKFYAVNPDGTEKWTRDFGEASQIFSTAAVRADGSIVFAVNAPQRSQSRVYAFDPEGRELWRRDRNGLIYSSPAIASDGTIYIGANDRRLHSFHGSGSPVSMVSSWPMFGRDIRHTSRATAATDTRLLNISTLGMAGGGADLIGGFAVRGTATKRYLIRGIGPTLTAIPVANPLPNPTVTVYAPGTAPLAFNDDWIEPLRPAPSLIQAMSSVGAFPLPEGSRDAVVLPSLAPGLYTAVIGASDGTGTALFEAYDPTPDDPNAALINLSTRGRVGPDMLIAGSVIRGTRPLRVLVRAVGPGLAPFNLDGVLGVLLARPALTVFEKTVFGERQIDANTNWSTSPLRADIAVAATLTGAFPLAANDSATVLILTPENSLKGFTIQVSGAGGTTGVVLVEIYVVP